MDYLLSGRISGDIFACRSTNALECLISLDQECIGEQVQEKDFIRVVYGEELCYTLFAYFAPPVFDVFTR